MLFAVSFAVRHKFNFISIFISLNSFLWCRVSTFGAWLWTWLTFNEMRSRHTDIPSWLQWRLGLKSRCCLLFLLPWSCSWRTKNSEERILKRILYPRVSHFSLLIYSSVRRPRKLVLWKRTAIVFIIHLPLYCLWSGVIY